MKNIFTKIALILFITASALVATAQSSKDKKFAKCVTEDGMMEVKLAELALNKASSAEIKTHAQHMVDDHSKANQELKALAVKKNIILPTSISEKQQKRYDKLAKLDGKEFDKKFSKQMKCDHKKAVCVFKKQAKKGDDEELKSWASGKVSTMEHHLDMWKAVFKKVKDDNSKSVTSK